MNPSACSATASAPGPELLHTAMPARVQASTSITSYPAPAEHTANRCLQRSTNDGPASHCDPLATDATSVRVATW